MAANNRKGCIGQQRANKMRPRRKDWAKLKADDVGGTLAESLEAFNNPESDLAKSELIPLDTHQVNKWGAATGCILKIEEGASAGDWKAQCRAAMDNFNNPNIPTLDLSDPDIMAMLDALVGTVLTDTERDSLVALATVKKSWSELHWPRDVHEGDVEVARGDLWL